MAKEEKSYLIIKKNILILFIYKTSSSSLEIKVSLFIYIMCLMAWIGWFLLVLFAGIGLTALPMDLIL